MHSPGLEVRPLRSQWRLPVQRGLLQRRSRARLASGGQPGDGWRLARTTLGTSASTSPPDGTAPRPARRLPRRPQREPPQETLRQAGALTADINAFGALCQRLLLRQLSGLQPGAEASVLKVASAWNDTILRRAVMDWQGAEAASLDGAGGEAAQHYLSVPPTLIGGGTWRYSSTSSVSSS